MTNINDYETIKASLHARLLNSIYLLGFYRNDGSRREHPPQIPAPHVHRPTNANHGSDTNTHRVCTGTKCTRDQS